MSSIKELPVYVYKLIEVLHYCNMIPTCVTLLFTKHTLKMEGGLC